MDPISIAQLYPSTPTPMPMSTPSIILQNSSYRIWNYADDAIMLWQWATPARTQVLQVAILVLIVVAFLFIATRWIQAVPDEGEL